MMHRNPVLAYIRSQPSPVHKVEAVQIGGFQVQILRYLNVHARQGYARRDRPLYQTYQNVPPSFK